MTEDQFRIQAGMGVIDRDGNRLGSLDSLLSENDTGRTRFLTVDGRLVPVEKVQGVEGDRVKLDLTRDKLREFPERRGSQLPSEDDLRRAYDAAGIRGPGQ